MTSPDFTAPGFVDDVLAAARAIPGVSEAVAVFRRRARFARPAAPTPPPAPALPRDEPDRPLAYLHGGELHIPEGAPTTLQEALRAAAELAPEKGTIYIRAGRDDELQTYPELLAEAERVLAGLRAAGSQPGEAVLFVFDDNRAYLTAFWACVLGGFVPTPVAVATTYDTPNEVNRKLHNAWNLLRRPILLTDTATIDALRGVRSLWDEPDVRLHTVDEFLAYEPDHDWFPATPQSPVLNLLTSGSTGVPKCVQHANASVVSRAYAVAEYCGLAEDDISLIWMPLDHVTVAFYNARDVVLRCLHINAKTDHFLSDPMLWPQWLDHYRVTNAWAPNFAFSMVNEMAAEIRERSWDLSCVRELVNGGEPVIAATSRRFLELLAPHGLRADAMRPAWGMSETCSGVTYTRQNREDPTAGTVAVDPTSLGSSIRFLPPEDENAVVLSTVGGPIPGVGIRIVGEDGSVLPEGSIGELRITGVSIMLGYFDNDAANRGAFDENGWFRTGDLAFVSGGEVVIAGRVKDQIIVRGINYLAHEIESVVERVDGVRVTFVAAVGLRDPGESTDRLVIFFVPQHHDPATLTAIAREIRSTLGREVGLAPDVLVPVTEEQFAKTSNGKIQRAALVTELRAGTFADQLIQNESDEQPDTWLVRRQWAKLTTPTHLTRPPGPVLLLADPATAEHLALENAVVADQRGADVRQLLAAVTDQHGPISTVVLALTAGRANDDPSARLAATTSDFTTVLGALASGDFGQPLLLVLTSGAVHAQEGDPIDLGTCAFPGLVRTAVTEAAPLVVRQVDLPAPQEPAEWREALQAELADRRHTGVVAIRQGQRWQPRLVPVDDDNGANAAGQPVVNGGLYLVTGGLGGIAAEICSYLLASHGVRLLLVGRSAPDGKRGKRLAELASLGAVEYRQIDVADADALEAAVAEAEEHWDRPLDGVLHLAGADVTGQWADLERHTIARETAATFAAQYQAKVVGTLAIARILESRPEAALTLFGSVNGEFGGHSFGAYSAANSFLVGFADHWHHERRRTVRCLGWSMWADVGMNQSQPTAAARHRGFRSIAPATGLRLYLTAAASPYHYLLIGLDLANPTIINELVAERLHVSELLVAYTADQVEPEQVRTALAPSARLCPVPIKVVRVSRIRRGDDGGVDAAQLLLDDADRPGGERAEPATDLERELARIWSDALDRPVNGRDDSFFDLGGNSLRATRLLALVDRRLAVRITTQQLYTTPTVAGMAAAVAQVRGAPHERPDGPTVSNAMPIESIEEWTQK